MLTRHRYPLILVDRILAIEEGRRIRALKNVTMNEQALQGHFPGCPIFPAIYTVEALCQCAQLLRRGLAGVTARLDRFKFIREVLPGDQLEMEVELREEVQGFCVFRGQALVAGQLAVQGTITGYFHQQPAREGL